MIFQFNIPLSVYRHLLRLSAIVIIGGFYYYNLESTNRVMKIASTVLFMIVMCINLINMDVTGHYLKNRNKIGPKKGETGSRGPNGFKKGESRM